MNVVETKIDQHGVEIEPQTNIRMNPKRTQKQNERTQNGRICVTRRHNKRRESQNPKSTGALVHVCQQGRGFRKERIRLMKKSLQAFLPLFLLAELFPSISRRPLLQHCRIMSSSFSTCRRNVDFINRRTRKWENWRTRRMWKAAKEKEPKTQGPKVEKKGIW